MEQQQCNRKLTIKLRKLQLHERSIAWQTILNVDTISPISGWVFWGLLTYGKSILSSNSNYKVDLDMWSFDQILVGYSGIFMREVIISQIIYGFVQKTDFEDWSWFNVNNLGLALGMALKFYSSVAKRWKLKVEKCWGELEGGVALSPSSHPE